MTDVLSEGPLAAPIRLLLAHGAGAPMTSPFMEKIAGLLIERGLGVSRFEFAYMRGAARTGSAVRRRRPNASSMNTRPR
jgi:predicted alpha/beta-hydrolase family hydrolase